MYRFKISKKDNFLNGRKVVWVGNELGLSRIYLYQVLNGKVSCSKLLAYGVTHLLGYNDIDEFFDLVEE